MFSNNGKSFILSQSMVLLFFNKTSAFDDNYVFNFLPNFYFAQKLVYGFLQSLGFAQNKFSFLYQTLDVVQNWFTI